MNLSGCKRTDLDFNPDELLSDAEKRLKAAHEGAKKLVKAIATDDAANFYNQQTNENHKDSITNPTEQESKTTS